MTGKIVGVTRPFGMQEKKDGSGTYGPCGLYDVSLESGEVVKVLLWNTERNVGDEVKLTKKGDFWNEESNRPQRQEIDLQPIVNYLKEIDGKLDKLLGNDERIMSDVEQTTATQEAKRDWGSVGKREEVDDRGSDFPPGYLG